MSENRITGLASTFEPGAGGGSAPPPSAVSSLASRFDAPQVVSDEPKVSEKLSGIANRFGATVADVPAKGGRAKVAPRSAPPVVPEPQPTPKPVEAERPDFSAISKRFASGRANEPDAGVEETPGMFASAKDAFTKIEEQSRPAAEGVVSQFKRDFEKGKHVPKEPSSAPVRLEKEKSPEKLVVAEEMAGVGNIKSRFEGGGATAVKEEVAEKEAPLASKFESATKLFDVEKEKEKEKAEEVAPQVDSKFAAASRVFAGGAN